MRLSIKGLAIASALLWGGGLLFVGLINLAAPSYGVSYLQMMSSLYPGFHNLRTFADVSVGTGYALLGGALAGLLLGWFYNLFASQSSQSAT